MYVRSDHAAACRAVRTDAVATGVMGMLGNKGGVAASIQLYDSSVAIVCSHLAAGQSHADDRNADFALQVTRRYTRMHRYDIACPHLCSHLQRKKFSFVSDAADATPRPAHDPASPPPAERPAPTAPEAARSQGAARRLQQPQKPR